MYGDNHTGDGKHWLDTTICVQPGCNHDATSHNSPSSACYGGSSAGLCRCTSFRTDSGRGIEAAMHPLEARP